MLLHTKNLPPKGHHPIFSRPYELSRYWYSVTSVCLSPSVVCNVKFWLNGAPQSKCYYWQPIGSRIWEIDWYQNEWPWPLFRGSFKVMSTIVAFDTWLSMGNGEQAHK